MLSKEITSLQHPIIKKCVKLRSDRTFRYENKQFVLAGKKLVKEAKNIEVLFLLKGSTEKISAKETYFVTEELLKKITGLVSPEPMAAIAEMKEMDSLKNKEWILALDGISDPGNLGTLMRTALALNWDGIFFTDSCVDPYNDKAIRAAKGATMRLPWRFGSVEELIQLAKGKTVWIGNLTGTPLSDISHRANTLLILGNESKGVSFHLLKSFPSLTIPIQDIESLNVASAGAILLYELKKL